MSHIFSPPDRMSSHTFDIDVFDIAMRNAGLDVPDDLRGGVRFVHAELAAMAALVRSARSAEAEPAAIFVLSAILAEASG